MPIKILRFSHFGDVEEALDLAAQRVLVGLERQDVVGLLADDRRNDLFLASHRIQCNGAAFQLQRFNQFRNRRDSLYFSCVFNCPKVRP
jgi:hypothetical protein